jgi:hypothetical protein
MNSKVDITAAEGHIGRQPGAPHSPKKKIETEQRNKTNADVAQSQRERVYGRHQ